MTDALAITQITFSPIPPMLSALSSYFLVSASFLLTALPVASPVPVPLFLCSAYRADLWRGTAVPGRGSQETGESSMSRPLGQPGWSPCRTCLNPCSRCSLDAPSSSISSRYLVRPLRGSALQLSSLLHDRCELTWTHRQYREAVAVAVLRWGDASR